MKFAVNYSKNQQYKHSDDRHSYNPIRSHPTCKISSTPQLPLKGQRSPDLYLGEGKRKLVKITYGPSLLKFSHSDPHIPHSPASWCGYAE